MGIIILMPLISLSVSGSERRLRGGNRAFPASDHASDIILAMERRMKELDVKIHLRSGVKKVLADENGVTGILLENDAVIVGDAVLVATGGLSYPTTGSTGDGYRFAGECGHDVTGLRPSLVPHGDRGRLYCRDAGTLASECNASDVYWREVLF